MNTKRKIVKSLILEDKNWIRKGGNENKEHNQNINAPSYQI